MKFSSKFIKANDRMCDFEAVGCGHILGLFYDANPRLCLYSTGLI